MKVVLRNSASVGNLKTAQRLRIIFAVVKDESLSIAQKKSISQRVQLHSFLQTAQQEKGAKQESFNSVCLSVWKGGEKKRRTDEEER